MDKRLPELNIPLSPDLRLRLMERGVEIYDSLRKKWLLLTPEEWVRQNFCHFLHRELGYPAGLMANEVSLKLNGTSRRCDTVVYDKALHPMMIIEYKAPEIQITKETFEQIGRYNLVLEVDYIVVSNGMHHYCCKLDKSSGSYHFLKGIPPYQEL